MALMRADTDDEIVSLLTAFGYWNEPAAWRYIGDIENNYSQVGNQQAEPIASLAEKLVNSIDARVINACLMAGVDPTSDDAPKSVREAVARFYGDGADRNGQTCQLEQGANPRGESAHHRNGNGPQTRDRLTLDYGRRCR